MTGSRAPVDPGTLSFEATVESGGREVTLSETYFYPEGGGQPADRGTLDGHRVADVQTRDGRVVHTLADGELAAGASVTGSIDPEFRRYCARAHTASHALYGAGRRLLDDLGYGGFGITEERVRVDFTTSTDITDGTLAELERLVNRAVWESRNVTWEERPRADALNDDAVAFNTKTEEGLAGDTVRVVSIDGWDEAACGGTHVTNTSEIGPVTVLSRSNPGEGLTRVEFAVGPTGIDRRATEKRAALDAAAALGTNVESLADRVAALRAERDDLKAERDDLAAELTAREVADLPTVERDGRTWLVGELDRDANTLAETARPLAGDRAAVVALVAPDGSLAVATDGEVGADEVVGEVTETFGGGGGGSPTVAQAGGLDADADAVVAFLRGE
ncbi:alanyl-tRNA editing protein [Halosegnis marinus]|uniref:Alanyl-tRNA editing protein n=1 Tax=Halosegnis marinus TaxID=3034023 RepID=A0ABD5ZKS0_9EURY|nr:DHHA1 domain-containing protein [Halosegnis sp. DT85]